MNTYKISFTRENGTQGADHFTAATEAQARKDFGVCYRHGSATIVSVELVQTDAPATKQQERDTLEKIKKMVAQLGPNSYLSAAFEGCFELAAENIENDWACSMADRVRRAEKRAEELEEKRIEAELGYNRLVDKLAESEKDYEAAHAAAHEIADQKDREIAQLKAQIAKESQKETACDRCQHSLLKKAAELERIAGEAERRAEAAEAEVIALKAKLYDFMVKGNAKDSDTVSTSEGPWWRSIKVPKEDRARVEAEDFRIVVRKQLAALNKKCGYNRAAELIKELTGKDKLTEVELADLPKLMDKAKEETNAE